MTKEELEETLKEARWTKRYRARRKIHYVYAQKRLEGKRLEVYIAPLSQLEHVTKEQVIEKLINKEK